MTSTDKIRYPDLALAVKKREEILVEQVFSLEDKMLYKAFEPAKEMLFSGQISFEKITPTALIARILDNFIDGTNSFHGFLSAYLGGDDYRDTLPLPSRDSFHYCFQK
ncbi:hypothetical protein H6768_04570 [Candidatus Peribacteria bacterium]|nr:hypothetical protein [Candidatus Peribacteria bacterium]